MPGNLLSTDILFPQFAREESSEQKIDKIMDYLYMLREQLRWSMNNLDAGNFNTTGLAEVGKILTDPISIALSDQEGRINELLITVEGYAGRLEDAEGNINNLQITAEGFAGRLSDAEGNITTLTATSEGLGASISSLKEETEGSISTLTQNVTAIDVKADGISATVSALETSVENDVTELKASVTAVDVKADGIRASVTSVEGTLANHTESISILTQTSTELTSTVSSLTTSTENGFTEVNKSISTVSQTADKIYWIINSGGSSSSFTFTSRAAKLVADEIDLTGYVTISSLGKNGSTSIDGARITTGTISAQRIDTDSIKLNAIYDANGKIMYSSGNYVYIGRSSGTGTTENVQINGRYVYLGKNSLQIDTSQSTIAIGTSRYKVGFFGHFASAKQRVTGTTAEAKVSSVISALQAYGLIY